MAETAGAILDFMRRISPGVQAATTPPALPAVEPPIAPAETRNLFTLALHLIVFRIGWTFKQESIIMAVFLDAIAGQDWVRGLLPTLSRLGQNIPPIWWARPLKEMDRKKRSLAVFTTLVAIPFLMLAGLWWFLGGESRPWLPVVFLALYFGFSVLYGLQQLSLGTVQGKLIRPTRRGRLLWLAQLLGLPPVVVLMSWLMPQWLAEPQTGFVRIFLFAGLSFLASGMLAQGLREEPGRTAEEAVEARRIVGGLRAGLAETWQVLRRDGNLRLLIVVAFLLSSVLVLAPHYQALARVRFHLAQSEMARLAPGWLVIQTMSVSLFSLVIGYLADRRGNRLTLRLLILGAAVAPVLAVAVAHLPLRLGPQLYWTVYIPQGLSPLLLLLLNNYTLEICAPEDHPRYLSTLTMCLLVPFLSSPLAGKVITLTSFEAVFLAAAVSMVASAVLTFWLKEPRHELCPGPRGTDMSAAGCFPPSPHG